MRDVIIVGGGPAGARAAFLLAEKGLDVLVVERKKAVGSPVQCAGLISPRTFELLGREFCILNKARGADIFSPSNIMLHIGAHKPKAFVVDRVGFDCWEPASHP
jgi:flavin-dependent dehydrogenase